MDQMQPLPAEYVVIFALTFALIITVIVCASTIERLLKENKSLWLQLEIEEAKKYGFIIVAKTRCPTCYSKVKRNNEPSMN